MYRHTAEGVPTVAPEWEVYKDLGAAQHCQECQQELGGLQQSRHVKRGCVCCGWYQVGTLCLEYYHRVIRESQMYHRDLLEISTITDPGDNEYSSWRGETVC